MGALALTSKAAYREPFEPLPGEVTFVPYDDVAALEAAVDDTVAAVVLEPIQGEAGVVVPSAGYLAAAQEVARDHGALFWLDEVQTGIGRTGAWFAHQLLDGIEPDVVTLAKGLGGGMPIGATVARERRPRCCSPATTARPSAATRSPRQPRWPSSTRSRPTASSPRRWRAGSSSRRCSGDRPGWSR